MLGSTGDTSPGLGFEEPIPPFEKHPNSQLANEPTAPFIRRSHPLLLPLNDGTLYTRNLLLRGMSAVYMMAFLGFYHQSRGK